MAWGWSSPDFKKQDVWLGPLFSQINNLQPYSKRRGVLGKGLITSFPYPLPRGVPAATSRALRTRG